MAQELGNNIVFIIMIFNNPIFQKQLVQTVISIFLIEKSVLNRFWKIICVQNVLRITLSSAYVISYALQH